MRTTCFVPRLQMCLTKAFKCPTNSSKGTCWRPLRRKDHVRSCKAHKIYMPRLHPCRRAACHWSKQMLPC